MIAATEFLNRVRPHCPGAIEPLLRQTLFDILGEFCEMTLVYTEPLDDLATVVGVTEYEIDPVAGKDLLQLVLVTKAGAPFSGYTFDGKALTLLTAPSVDGFALKLTGAFRPNLAADYYDDVFARWKDGICSGVLARMLLQPGKVWTNEATGAIHDAKFRSTINRARITKNQQFAGHSLRVTPRKFM